MNTNGQWPDDACQGNPDGVNVTCIHSYVQAIALKASASRVRGFQRPATSRELEAMPNAQSIDEQIGKNLRLLRMFRGMDQEQLGQLVCMSYQQIQKHESGVVPIGAGLLLHYAAALDVSVVAFFDGVDAQHSKESYDRDGTTRH